MRELTSYFSVMAVFNRVGQELRRGIQYVREIDDALVELRKVTDETDESYDKFLRTAAKTGSVIGATISEVTEATATFSKLGYDMEMATEMAESAIVYKNVGDNIASAEDAADSIISTLKGFRLESSETMRIVDRFNEVGKSIAHVI
jgi:TP901 family phage tail tape measure protein